MLFVHILQEIKEPTAFACLNYIISYGIHCMVVGFSSMLSQIQDDLSLYYNMVAEQW